MCNSSIMDNGTHVKSVFFCADRPPRQQPKRHTQRGYSTGTEVLDILAHMPIVIHISLEGVFCRQIKSSYVRF